VTHVAVAAGSRRRGIGALLVDRAVEIAGSAGLARLELVTPADDPGAQSFYERTGWVRDGTLVSRSGERFVPYHRDVPGADREGRRTESRRRTEGDGGPGAGRPTR